jgi:hypothetical protein
MQNNLKPEGMIHQKRPSLTNISQEFDSPRIEILLIPTEK